MVASSEHPARVIETQTSPANSYDLVLWIVNSTRLKDPRVHRCFAVVIALLSALCVVAAISRYSLLPLLPVPLFAFAAYSLRKIHTRIGNGPDNDSTNNVMLIRWASALVAAVLVGFFLIARVTRWLG